ncbi:MAG: rhodanese-like domain-containing protein [Hyphomicrobiales bacterium]|nr:rhodanese-like domain-containing protein [Hyphomicrobiales bacterium]
MAGTEDLANGTLVLLSPEEAKALHDRGDIVFVDVRNPEEFAAARIKGSALHPLKELEPDAIPVEQRKIVLVCAVGIRSRIAADALMEGGRGPIAHLEGGLQAWAEAGLPIESGEPSEHKI